MSGEGEILRLEVADTRRCVAYLVVAESDQYIAVMDVLESSVTDLTPAEVTRALQSQGVELSAAVVERRLDRLRAWDAVSARTDAKLIKTRAELLARNWRYTATPAGRQVQRFYRTVLAGAATMREIPLASLARVVNGLDVLRHQPDLPPVQIAEQVGRIFTSHDDLDSALVGAEDALAALADRFDLDDEHTADLKGLLVDYATHVAAELERGSARAQEALLGLQVRYVELADSTIAQSDAKSLIERGALTASKGGRPEDWFGLMAWFDPRTGRSHRFALRLIRALPGMHANLRRLHSTTGTATGRARALAFARACSDPVHGTAVFNAAVGDHSWRKLHGTADDADTTRVPSWRSGPLVPIPDQLAKTGRSGARGRASAARDDTVARERLRSQRIARLRAHDAAMREILSAKPGAQLTEAAARVALASLMAAVRKRPSRGRRRATTDGLACTVVHTGRHTGVVMGPTWTVLLPGRLVRFHLPAQSPELSDQEKSEPSGPALLGVEGVA
ncbi:MAG: DUF2397 domain-containing protein [Pseudonocardiaceae bacterium]